jgi:hypothetical protein
MLRLREHSLPKHELQLSDDFICLPHSRGFCIVTMAVWIGQLVHFPSLADGVNCIRESLRGPLMHACATVAIPLLCCAVSFLAIGMAMSSVAFLSVGAGFLIPGVPLLIVGLNRGRPEGASK